MTIKDHSEKPIKTKVEIDTNEPEGNAFAIMANCKKINNELQLGYDMDKIIFDEMWNAKNYDELLEIVEKYFGDYVIIYR